MSCEFARYDGAYVLGALSPAERAQYQGHLADCADCTRDVQLLAGLPGLLARVPVDVLESPGDEPVPDTLLPALVLAARRSRRRRTWAVVGSAAAAVAAAVIVVAGSLTAGGPPDEGPAATPAPSPSASSPVGRAMAPVGSGSMSATLALTSVDWGTRLDLTCSYQSTPRGWGEPEDSTYAMFVRTRDGGLEQVATWRALPGRTMRLTAATSASRDDIASVVIRTAGGTPVLELSA